jgi:hypothetical protein
VRVFGSPFNEDYTWTVPPNMPTPPQPFSVSARQTFSGVDLNGAETRSIAPPLSDSLRSACSPLCELGLDQVTDQTPIALCEREFIRKARFQK